MPVLKYKEDYYENNYYDKKEKINNNVRRTSDKTKRQVRELMNDDFRSHHNKDEFNVDGELLQTISEVFPSSFYRSQANVDFKKALNDFKKSSNKNMKKNKPQSIELQNIDEEKDSKIEAKKEKRNKIKHRIFNAFLCICAFAILFLICYRETQINEKFNMVEKAKKDLDNRKIVNEQLEADIDVQTDLNYIENYAKYQLGMQKPTDNQIIYINVEKKDKIITPIKIEEDNVNKVWYEKVFDKIENLFN